MCGAWCARRSICPTPVAVRVVDAMPRTAVTVAGEIETLPTDVVSAEKTMASLNPVSIVLVLLS